MKKLGERMAHLTTFMVAVLMTLKLTEYITISWWVVFAPWLIPAVFCVVILILIGAISVISEIRKKINEKDP